MVFGFRIHHDREAHTITIDQSQYTEKILARYGMYNCNPVSTPAEPGLILTSQMSPQTDADRYYMLDKPFRSVIGSLIFAMVCTRPDIALAVGMVCHNPGKRHWEGAICILAYLHGHTNLGITYDGNQGLVPHGHSDANWADDRDQRRSTTCYVFFLAISWKSHLQPTVSLSRRG
jgi:hypothetical protein